MNTSNSTNDTKEIWLHLVRFLLILGVSLGLFWIFLPWIKQIGVPSQEGFKGLSEFVQVNAFNKTNSIYLYVIGCALYAAVALICLKFVFPRIARFEKKGVGATVFCAAAAAAAAWFLGAQVIGPGPFALSWKMLLWGILWVPVIFVLLKISEEAAFFRTRIVDGVFLGMMFLLTLCNEINYFDQSNFIYVINDLIRGKDILFNSISMYGFWNMYFLAGVFKVFGVSDAYGALTVAISLFYFVGYAFVYFLLRNYTGNKIYSGLATICILIVNFFVFAHIPLHWTPSAGLLRFGMFLPVAGLLYSQRMRANKSWGWLLALSVAVAVFWVIEIGIYTLVAFAGAAVLKYCFREGKDRDDLFKALPKIFLLLAAAVIVMSARIWFKYGALPRWEDLFYFQRFFIASGSFVKPLDHFYLWPLLVVFYFAAFYAVLSFYNRLRHGDSWLFLTLFGMQAMLYYVSQVYYSNLARIALPATILLFIFLGFLLNKGRIWKDVVYGLTAVMTAGLIATVGHYGSQKSFAAHLSGNLGEFWRNAKTDALSKIMPKDKIQQVRYDVAVIQRLVGPKEPAVVVSKHDTLYYWYAGRKAPFKIAFYPNSNFLASDVDDLFERILTSKSPYVFIDRSTYQCYNNAVSSHGVELKKRLAAHFRLVENLGLLDLYERSNPQ